MGRPRIGRQVPACILHEVVDLRAAGKTFKAIAQAFNARGVKTPNDRLWYPATIERVYEFARGAAARPHVRQTLSRQREVRSTAFSRNVKCGLHRCILKLKGSFFHCDQCADEYGAGYDGIRLKQREIFAVLYENLAECSATLKPDDIHRSNRTVEARAKADAVVRVAVEAVFLYSKRGSPPLVTTRGLMTGFEGCETGLCDSCATRSGFCELGYEYAEAAFRKIMECMRQMHDGECNEPTIEIKLKPDIQVRSIPDEVEVKTHWINVIRDPQDGVWKRLWISSQLKSAPASIIDPSRPNSCLSNDCLRDHVPSRYLIDEYLMQLRGGEAVRPRK